MVMANWGKQLPIVIKMLLINRLPLQLTTVDSGQIRKMSHSQEQFLLQQRIIPLIMTNCHKLVIMVVKHLD